MLSSTKNDGPERSTKGQYMALICNVLISFGDAIEYFLPAVITQPISCELGISIEEEHTAAVCLYVSSAVMSILCIPISNRIGRRLLLLVSMYLSIIVTVICSIVPNYTFLVLSRVLLGCALALNLGTTSVYMAEVSTNKSFFTLSITIMTTAYSLGGGWCGLLGYFLIERIGWRYFILFTSLPIFIPPLLLLQFYLPETLNKDLITSDSVVLIDGTPKLKSIIARTVKLAFYTMTSSFIYFGDILLVPVIMRDINKSKEVNVPCSTIHGVQFLAISVLFGGCHIMGRIINYLFQSKLTSTAIFIVCSMACLPFTALCCINSQNHAVILLCIAALQIILSSVTNELHICGNDKEFFTQKYIAAASGIFVCVSEIMCAVTGVVSEVMEYQKTFYIHVGCAILSLLISFSFCTSD